MGEVGLTVPEGARLTDADILATIRAWANNPVDSIPVKFARWLVDYATEQAVWVTRAEAIETGAALVAEITLLVDYTQEDEGYETVVMTILERIGRRLVDYNKWVNQ